MCFFVNKYKQSIVVIIMLLLIAGSIMSLFIIEYSRSIQVSILLSVVPYCFFLGEAMYEYKTFIEIDKIGLRMFRRGINYKLLWNEIKRIEYRGSHRIPVFGMLVIHMADRKLYVEANFLEYRKLWKLVVAYYRKYAENALVDIDVPV